MRSHKLFTVLGLLMIVSMTLAFVGCGDDDETPTGVNGSLSDPEFQAVQDQFDYFVDSTLEFVASGMGNLYAVTGSSDTLDPVLYGPVDPNSDSDFVSIGYANGWHYASVTKVRTSYQASLYDSVSFYNDGSVQQLPSGADSLLYRRHWHFNRTDTTVTHTNYSGDLSLDIGGLDGSVSTVSGSHQFEANHKLVTNDSTIWADYTFDGTLTNLTVSKTVQGWVQGCPESGSLNASVSVSLKRGAAAPVVSTWTISATFNDGTVSVTVTRGNTTWTYTRNVCSVPA